MEESTNLAFIRPFCLKAASRRVNQTKRATEPPRYSVAPPQILETTNENQQMKQSCARLTKKRNSHARRSIGYYLLEDHRITREIVLFSNILKKKETKYFSLKNILQTSATENEKFFATDRVKKIVQEFAVTTQCFLSFPAVAKNLALLDKRFLSLVENHTGSMRRNDEAKRR